MARSTIFIWPLQSEGDKYPFRHEVRKPPVINRLTLTLVPRYEQNIQYAIPFNHIVECLGFNSVLNGVFIRWVLQRCTPFPPNLLRPSQLLKLPFISSILVPLEKQKSQISLNLQGFLALNILFKLNCSRRFPRAIIKHPVHALHFIYDPSGHCP